MSKILIVHPDLSSIGGSAKLAFGIIETLFKLGYDISLLTFKFSSDIKYIYSYFDLSQNILHSIKFINPYKFSQMSRILQRAHIPYLLKQYYFIPNIIDLIISKIKQSFDLIINSDAQKLHLTSDINYVHFPIIASFKEEDLFKNHFGTNKGPLKTLYYSLIKPLVVKRFYKVNRESIILANSKFTARYIYKYYKLYPQILYPFIDINKFSKIARSKERKNYVISIGRISPEKNYEIIPLVAKYSRNVEKFIIIGSTYPGSYKLIQNILRKATRLNVKNKIAFIVNANFSTIQNFLSQSKIFLHTMKYEHFGIAVVEAMASGLIPVVHKSGGPWIDIIEAGKYGYGYDDPEEAAQIIDELIIKNTERLAYYVVNRSKNFDKKRFMERLTNIIINQL